MKSLNDIIAERLKISSRSSFESFTDKELLDDFEKVSNCFSKSDKLPYMKKYDVSKNRIEDIQNVILKLLKENRKNKEKFNSDDVWAFYRLGVPDRPYSKNIPFFDDEPLEFIKYIKYYFENENKNFKRAKQSLALRGMNHISIADRHIISRYNNVVKYLEENK